MPCESRGTVRKILEEDGEFLVSFPSHDGYFKIPPSPAAAELRKKIFTAQKEKEEISFTYDKELNILDIR